MDNKKASNYNYAQMFNGDVVRWRQIAAKLWSILLIFGVVLVHSVTANYNPITNFGSFFVGFFLNLFSIQFWFYSSMILAIFWVLFSFNDSLFRVTPKVYSNNLEKVLQNVYSMHSLCIACNLAATVVISYFLLNFYNQELQISYFYVCGFCAMSNFIMKFQFAFQEKYLLNWPIIEQTKYVRFKSKVYGLALNCLKSVFFHMVVWKIVYFFIGSCIFNNLFSNSSKQDSSNVSNFMTSFISVKLAFILNLSHTVSWLIYEIYMTEIYHFNIQSNIHTPFCLPSSMSLNTHSYIQTLAFIDFAYISVYSAQKRKQLFNLSYTNNQPLNWVKTSTEALNLIKSFMEVFNFDDMLHGKVMNQPDTPTRFQSGSILRRVNVTSPMRENMNNSLGDLNYMKSPIKQNPANSGKELQQSNSFMNTLSQKLMGFLKKQQMFSNIYKENKNYKTEQLFVDSFLVINALKGLSNLAMSSYTEDEYGIVQQTLPDIINTFLELQKILEKFNPTHSSTTISFKVLQRSDANKIELLMQKLTFILNESLFKITQTFGPSLKSLALNEESMNRMKRFYLCQ